MGRWMAVILGLILLAGWVTPALAVEGNLTISDREIIERLTRLEEGQKSLEKRIDSLDKRIDGLDKRIDGLDKRIDGLQSQINGLQSQISDLHNLIVGGFGIVFVGIFGLFGFVIWDRRTAITPVVRKTRELEEREELTVRVLKAYADKEPRLAEVMRSLGLL